LLRILIVDDHPRVREALARVLQDPEGEVEVAGVAASGEEAIALLERQPVEVVLLDVSMPGMDGLEVTARLQARFPPVKVLLLTLLGHATLLRRALEAGATGYLLKTSGKKELLAAIRAVAAGQTYLDPEVAGWLGETDTAPAHSAGEPVPGEPGEGAAAWPFALSERERALLRGLARGDSLPQLEEALLVSRPTLERYLAQLGQKTGTTGTDALRAWARRHFR
jgi:DNA-binding NarL/FixJ family response regulator